MTLSLGRKLKFIAAILEQTGSDLIVDEVELQRPLSYGQVLVRLVASGICGAQINEIDGRKGPDGFLPHLLGHEGYAEVIEVGPQVTTVSKGDRVILHWMKGEGIEADPAEYHWRGSKLNAGWVTTFNQMAVVSENRCTPIHTDLSPLQLPTLGCSLTTALGVVSEELRIGLGESLLIFGAGGVGLSILAVAKASGASPITVCDPVPARLEAALDLGATNVFLVSPDSSFDLGEKVDLTHYDYIVETSGARSAIELACRIAGNHSQVLLVGVPDPTSPASIRTLPLHLGMSLKGTKGGAISPNSAIHRLLQFGGVDGLASFGVPTQVHPLEQINLAIQAVRAGAVGRQIIDFQNQNSRSVD